MQNTLSSGALPAPYLCSDPGSFAEYTLVVRLPEIGRRILSENDFPAEVRQRIEDFLAGLPDGTIRDIADPGAPDLALWNGYLRPYLGSTWRQLSFWVCENTFYRRVLEATGYFQNGATAGVDPYLNQKNLGLETSRQAINALVQRLETWQSPDFSLPEVLREAIESTLWSNRADLSLWPANAKGTLPIAKLHQAADFLLDDELPGLIEQILTFQAAPRRVDFQIDNAGYELVGDLAFADLLLSRRLAQQIHFHVKAHPTFVSDALAADVRRTVAFLKQEADEKTAGFGQRLNIALETQRLCLDADFYWNSPLPGWEMPALLKNSFTSSALVVSKGDANYRRLLGDLRWPETTPFAKATAYFPTRLAALRTAKSEVVVGLKPGQTDGLDRKEPDWRTNGRWGLVQIN